MIRWQIWFLAILLFSCVDGFLSNWLYPKKLPLLYRDFLVLAVYILFITQEPVRDWIARFRKHLGPLLWFFAFCFLIVGTWQMFNPGVPNLLVGLLGFKVVFFYWPLAVLAFAYADSLDRVRFLIRVIVFLSIFINLFGLYQFWAGPEFLVETFGPGFERATILAHLQNVPNPEDTFLRIIGTFSSSGQYANFLIINAAFCVALMLTASTRVGRLFYLGLILLNFAALLATGSRGGLLTLGFVTLVMSRFCSSFGKTAWVGFAVGLGLYFGFNWLGENVVERFETLRDIDMITQRTVGTTPVMFAQLFKEAPLGQGMGLGSTATRYLLGVGSSGLRLIENHLSKLQLETGILGVIFFYLFVCAFLLRWARRWRIPSDRAFTDLTGPLSAYCVTILALSFIIGGFDSPPQAIFFWALIGLVSRAHLLRSPETAA